MSILKCTDCGTLTSELEAHHRRFNTDRCACGGALVNAEPPVVDICFVFFKTLTLAHLDAAWYSVSRQDFTHVRRVYFLDNDTAYSQEEIDGVLDRYPLPVECVRTSVKHGNPKFTQSWSVNRVVQQAESPWVFFCRADYILAFDCLSRMLTFRDALLKMGHRPFISGWCWQMAYDREARNIDAHVDIEQYGWRERGLPALLEHPYAFKFHETNQDAGVWLTQRDYMAQAGWMNEQLSSWGYQQSTFQRALLHRAGALSFAYQDYLFAHQHHAAPRDFEVALREYQQFGEGM